MNEDFNENLNQTNNVDSNNNVNTKLVVAVICIIVFIVVGLYFSNFHYRLSEKNEAWGTFGDYFGGILNPVIAAFAFYLIAKTYELQKRELEATRSLLEVSTNAQEKQIKLAALTALFNSNLMKIDMLETERIQIDSQFPSDPRPSSLKPRLTSDEEKIQSRYESLREKLKDNRIKFHHLIEKNEDLEQQIKTFLVR